ncbi:MAG TPA: aminopeptidase P family protein [Ktedonobacteraceae bacterium]|jgi:Xaa-Pro aminopeptidase
MTQAALSQLRTWMTEQSIDALFVTQPHNRSYLSGWLDDDAESGSLLVGQQQQILLTNHLYREVAEHNATGWHVIVPPAREQVSTIVSLAQEYGWKKIGFEAAHISYSEYVELSKAGKDTFALQSFDTTALDAIRQVKEPHEIELLKRAIAITDEAFSYLCEWLQPGMTEKQVQWEVSRKMIELGADGPAFGTIVASGPNGSMPHARPSDRRIQPGELITIDMGARYKGYCADMTRTVCLGEPAKPRMRELYDAVLRAMRTCEQGLRAGLSGRAGDALARDVLVEAGLGEYYIHSTGHGVGLQVHEKPSLSMRAPEDVGLPVGSVVTVEPGVYIPGWSGLRIEDCVLVKENGVEVLTQSPTELVLSH